MDTRCSDPRMIGKQLSCISQAQASALAGGLPSIRRCRVWLVRHITVQYDLRSFTPTFVDIRYKTRIADVVTPKATVASVVRYPGQRYCLFVPPEWSGIA